MDTDYENNEQYNYWAMDKSVYHNLTKPTDIFKNILG